MRLSDLEQLFRQSTIDSGRLVEPVPGGRLSLPIGYGMSERIITRSAPMISTTNRSTRI
jgi:hypothetical protein